MSLMKNTMLLQDSRHLNLMAWGVPGRAEHLYSFEVVLGCGGPCVELTSMGTQGMGIAWTVMASPG